MPALVRRFNYRNVELYPETRGETIGVLLGDGSSKFCRWLGFIDREQAKRLPDARPVKLVASRYSNESDIGGNWQDVPADCCVQGCLTSKGVYAVTCSRVRLVPRHSRGLGRGNE